PFATLTILRGWIQKPSTTMTPPRKSLPPYWIIRCLRRMSGGRLLQEQLRAAVLVGWPPGGTGEGRPVVAEPRQTAARSHRHSVACSSPLPHVVRIGPLCFRIDRGRASGRPIRHARRRRCAVGAFRQFHGVSRRPIHAARAYLVLGHAAAARP